LKKSIEQGTVEPTNKQGIKVLVAPEKGYTHELKINHSAARILGKFDENGVLIFDRFLPKGLHYKLMSTPYPILDDFLPDFQIKQDLLHILWEDELECEIELETGTIQVPRDALLEVISKSYMQNKYDIGFGNYYVAQVAIGGVKK
jgi:hypothetical protein